MKLKFKILLSKKTGLALYMSIFLFAAEKEPEAIMLRAYKPVSVSISKDEPKECLFPR